MKLGSSIGLGVGIVSFALYADASFAGRGGGTASFSATGPAGMQIVGTTHDVALQEDPQNIVAVTVALGALSTGIDLRDKHMREKYLEVQTYPTAVLRVARSDLKVPAAGVRGEFDAEGTMSLHGKTRPVKFHYVVERDGNTFGVTATTSIDMTEFGIEAPRYLGVSVKPRVNLNVGFMADDRP